MEVNKSILPKMSIWYRIDQKQEVIYMKSVLRTSLIICLIFAGVCSLWSADKKVVPVPYAKWGTAKTLEGGGGLRNTTLIPAFDQWYTGKITAGPKYYAINVVKDATYEIYWDDKTEGSKKYTADINVFVFQMDAKTKYDSKDSGYTTPITFKAKETTVNIVINAFGAGNYAFGIRKK
jgi:hypothetical protein